MIRLVLCSNYIDLKINRLDFNPGIILKTLSVQSCVPKVSIFCCPKVFRISSQGRVMRLPEYYQLWYREYE